MMTQHLWLTEYRVVQEKAEDLLAKFQRQYGLSEACPVPVQMIAETQLGLHCDLRDLSRVHRRAVGALIADRREIAVDERCNAHQYCFAIAHEIGHCILHEGCGGPHIGADAMCATSVLQVLGSARARTSQQRTELRDMEANWFAAALQVPRPFLSARAQKYEVIDARAVCELASVFGVSRETMLNRLESLSHYLDWNGPPIQPDSLNTLRGRLAWHCSTERLQDKRHQRHLPVSGSSANSSETRHVGALARHVYDYLRLKHKDWVTERAQTKPFVIEFAGTPNAGKDTLIRIITDYLVDVEGCKVAVLDEAVKTSPLGKRWSPDQLYWMVDCVCHQLLEVKLANAGNYDFVILNRGVFDALAFVHMARARRFITEELELLLSNQLLNWTGLINVVFEMIIPPAEAIHRESNEVQIVANLANSRSRKAAPRKAILNVRTLDSLNSAYDYVHSRYGGMFHEIYPLNVAGDQTSVSEKAQIVAQLLPSKGQRQLPIPQLAWACYRIANLSDKPAATVPQPPGQSRTWPQTSNTSGLQLSFL